MFDAHGFCLFIHKVQFYLFVKAALMAAMVVMVIVITETNILSFYNEQMLVWKS